jgi:hypothetical protein
LKRGNGSWLRLRVKGFELLKEKKKERDKSESGFGCLTENEDCGDDFYFYFDRK